MLRPGFDLHLIHDSAYLIVRTLGTVLASLSLSFLIHQMGTILYVHCQY